jgi:hypothetical protein
MGPAFFGNFGIQIWIIPAEIELGKVIFDNGLLSQYFLNWRI